MAGRAAELEALGFAEVRTGRRLLYLAPEIANGSWEIAARLDSMEERRESGLGNKRSAVAIEIDGAPPMFARRYRRGGLMRFLVAEHYAGVAPRPMHELAVAACALKRGVPTAEPFGASVEWAAPGLYRGWFLTRALKGATLWDLLLTGEQPSVRRQLLECAAASIGRMHEGGLYHADLNFHNLFARTDTSPLEVVLLDLDKARLYPAPLTPHLRRRNLYRLTRSARKLIDAGATLTVDDLAVLGLKP